MAESHSVFEDGSSVGNTENDEESGREDGGNVFSKGRIGDSGVVEEHPGEVADDHDGEDHISGAQVPLLVLAEKCVSEEAAVGAGQIDVHEEVNVEEGVCGNETGGVAERNDVEGPQNPPVPVGADLNAFEFLGPKIDEVASNPKNANQSNSDGSAN